jgi:4-amino-4-deoxy-L-arabinose transferase-like glycosyltransferase
MQVEKKDRLIALVLFALAFAMRLALISKGPYYVDALELAMKAEKTLQTLTLNYMHVPGHPLVVILASAILFLTRVFGINDPVFSVNFMSVIFGSLSIGIFYLLARKFLDERGSLMASLILCFFPLHLYVSTIGFNHAVSIFFHLFGIYFLFLYLEKYELQKMILSAFLLGLGAASRLADGFIMFAVIFLFITWSFKYSNLSGKSVFRNLLGFLLIYGATIILFYLPAFFTGALSEMQNSVSGLYYLYFEPRSIILMSKEIVAVFDGGGLVLLIAGVVYFFIYKNRILLYFLLLWFLSLFLFYGNLSIEEIRFFLLPLIPAFVMLGYFISRLRKGKAPLYQFMLLLIVVNFSEPYKNIYLRHVNNFQEDFAKFVARSTEPDSYIVAMDEGPFIEYYSKRKVLYKAIGLDKNRFNAFFTEVDRLIEEGSIVYIISSGIYAYDPRKYFINTLNDRYDPVYVGCHLNQDWHSNGLYSNDLFKEKLYRLKKKNI